MECYVIIKLQWTTYLHRARGKPDNNVVFWTWACKLVQLRLRAYREVVKIKPLFQHNNIIMTTQWYTNYLCCVGEIFWTGLPLHNNHLTIYNLTQNPIKSWLVKQITVPYLNTAGIFIVCCNTKLPHPFRTHINYSTLVPGFEE